MRLFSLLAIAALTANAAEIPLTPPPIESPSKHAWCATDPALNARLEALDRAARDRSTRSRDRIRAMTTSPPVRFQDGVFILERDDVTVPFDVNFDLQGKSFFFERLAADRYRMTRESAFQYDENVGPNLTRFSARDSYHMMNLTKFVFPFYGSQMQRMHLGASPAIHFETPAIISEGQYGPLELVSEGKPLIAPFIFARGNLFNPASLYVREETDRVVVTWRSLSGLFRYDVQAVLFADGNVRFAYKEAQNAQGTAFAFTSGVESMRNERVSLLTATDAKGDTRTNIPATVKDMLDIESVSFERIGGSEYIEISVKFAQPINPAVLTSSDRLTFVVFFNSQYSSYAGYAHVNGDPSFFLSAWGDVDPKRVRIDGSTMTFPVLQRYLPAVTDRITVATYGPAFADELSVHTVIPPAARAVDSDVSAIEATTFDRPLFQAFPLGALNPRAIWDRIESVYGLTESDYDGVAIYQTFYTNIISYATAYSTVGNAGADGVWYSGSQIGERYPRRPALLHMNKVGHSANGSTRGASFLLHHEFGHHWLYNLRIMDNGSLSNILNPISAHPAQYVHTPAKNSVFVSSEYSAMGGSNFSEVEGKFVTPSELGYYSFSSHELYLMGLVPPGEVSDWYIIQNSSPELGKAYHPPTNTMYTGTKKTIAFQQLLDGMGPRKPAFETSPKEFKVLFVLVDRPTDPATPAHIATVAGYARNFVDSFSKATGGRGSIKLTESVCLPPSITRQPDSFAVASGATATLTIDVSGSEPISIQWYRGLKGDTSTPIAGATSKSYTTPPVTVLTNFWARATNACGSVDSSGAVVTIAAPHRRGARR